MIDGVVLAISVPVSGNKFPKELPPSELELRTQESFVTRGKWVVHDYFIEGSVHYPERLSFFVYARDKNKENKLVGGLIATKENVDGFEFTYYDKIFVIPGYRKNRLMPAMIGKARMVYGENDKIVPAILRTSDPKLSKAYGELSDICLEIGNYHVHGFGFLDKNTKEELFDEAEKKFGIAAEFIASKEPTLVNAPFIYRMSPKIGIKIDKAMRLLGTYAKDIYKRAINIGMN